MEVLDVDYDADIEIISQELSNLISQLSLFGRDLSISCGENIVFKGSGELGTMSAIEWKKIKFVCMQLQKIQK